MRPCSKSIILDVPGPFFLRWHKDALAARVAKIRKEVLMKKITILMILLGLLAFFPPRSAFADVITLENGSTLIGTISRIDQKTIHIQTDFAGLVSVDAARVVSYTTDKPVYVAFPGHDPVRGKLTYTRKQTRIDVEEGKVVVSADAPQHVWPEGAADPRARHWSFEIGFDAAGKTGNAERISVGSRAQARLQGPRDRLLLYLRYAYAKDDGLESDNQTVGGIDFESYFREKHSWYARMEMENDQIAHVDFRATAAAGYGYFFLKKANHTLRGRTGLMFRHESLKSASSTATAGLDLGLSHLYRFANAWRLTNDITYTPSLEDYRDYRIYHESAFEIPIVASEIWKLRLGVMNDYNSRPAENKDYLDTTYFTRLVFSWQ